VDAGDLFVLEEDADHALDAEVGAERKLTDAVAVLVGVAVVPELALEIAPRRVGGEPTTEFQGGIKTQITEYEYTGRTFFFGISARLAR